MGKKKTVMRRVAALLAASMVLTSSAFTSLAAVNSRTAEAEESRVYVTNITLDKETLNLEVGGDGQTLSALDVATASNADADLASVNNADATVDNVHWTVDDEEVAKIEGEAVGKTVTVVPVGPGTTKVVATIPGSNMKVSCTVEVAPIEADKELTKAPVMDDVLKDLSDEDRAAVVERVKEQMEEIESAMRDLPGEIAKENISGLENVTFPEGVDPEKVVLKVEKAAATATEAKLLYDENGDLLRDENRNPIVKVVVKELQYDIALVDENDENVDLSANEALIHVTVNLPVKNIDEEDNNAAIEHGKVEGEDISWQSLGDSQITRANDEATTVISTTSFSPFKVTLSHKDEPTTPDEPSRPSTPSRGGSSGGGSSRNTAVSGTWHQDATGWWFQYTNGGYAANKWELINGKWYYFNESGYAVTGWQLINGQWYYLDLVNCDMQTGWHLDSVDGKWYYLTASGAMATGWVEVNGKSYYLSETATEATYTYDGTNGAWVYTNGAARPFGSMYVSETTPDGYQVDANGAWIQ